MTDAEFENSLIMAVMACHGYFRLIAKKWKDNDGKISMTVEGGVIVVDDDVDDLADKAGRLLIQAVKNIEKKRSQP